MHSDPGYSRFPLTDEEISEQVMYIQGTDEEAGKTCYEVATGRVQSQTSRISVVVMGSFYRFSGARYHDNTTF